MVKKEKVMNFKEKIKNVFKLDTIRILKLLEIFQFAIIGFILGYINGTVINKYLLIEFDKKKYITKKYPLKSRNRNPLLILHLIYDILVITVTTYFLKKTTRFFPFIFDGFHKDYKTSLKQENLTGFTIGLGFVYIHLLQNFRERLKLISV